MRWIIVETVPAIVSQGALDRVQAKLAENQSFASRNNTAHQYLLRASVSCGHSRLASTARANNGRDFYCACNGKMSRIQSRLDTLCPARRTPARQLDLALGEHLGCTPSPRLRLQPLRG